MILDCVHDEDKIIVKNIVAVIEKLKTEKIFTSWNVEAVSGIYLLSAYINETDDFEISNAELQSIQDVNPLRIISAAVGRSGGKSKLRIRVSDRNEPIILTETQLFTVRKRSRWAV